MERTMKTKADYEALHVELRAIELANGIYLADMCIDRENLDPDLTDESGDHYWDGLYFVACNDAGIRAEELGLDINALIGRIIY